MSHGTQVVLGRPTKLTPELQTKFAEYIRQGNTPTNSCRLVGIHYITYCNWMDSAETQGEGSPCWDFYLAVNAADAQNQKDAVDNYFHLAKTSPDFRAAQSYLERRHGWAAPATNVNVGVTANGTAGEVSIDLGNLTIEQKMQYLALLEIASADPKQLDQAKIIDICAQESDDDKDSQ